MLLAFLDLLKSLPAPFYMAVGGILTAIVTGSMKFFKDWRGDNREDRESYSNEIAELRRRIDTVEKEVSKWRHRYYVEQEYAARLRVQLINAQMTPVERHGQESHYDNNHEN